MRSLASFLYLSQLSRFCLSSRLNMLRSLYSSCEVLSRRMTRAISLKPGMTSSRSFLVRVLVSAGRQACAADGVTSERSAPATIPHGERSPEEEGRAAVRRVSQRMVTLHSRRQLSSLPTLSRTYASVSTPFGEGEGARRHRFRFAGARRRGGDGQRVCRAASRRMAAAGVPRSSSFPGPWLGA